jgi:tRNA (mo5U34)-methyltransferase
MNAEAAVSVSEFRRLAAEFPQKTLSLGYADLNKYCWYHTVDLGNGLVTPGWYDYRESLAAFNFQTDMKGMNVLEVGSATGFFAFEFERRGANVTSTEIPSFDGWDRFPGETPAQTLEKFIRDFHNMEQVLPLAERRADLLKTFTLAEAHHYTLDGPFKFCHAVLESKVRRYYSTVYDLSKEKLGRDKFDLVFLGDMLLHTLYPLKALAKAAELCSGSMMIVQEFPETAEPQAAMTYIGGDRVGYDSGVWWLPNRTCLEQMLRKLGFREVSLVGEHSGFMRPFGSPYKRQIVQAAR